MAALRTSLKREILLVYDFISNSEASKKRTKTVVNTNNPTWNQTFMYPRIHLEDLRSKVIEVTVWDYDRFGSNEFLGEVLIELANIAFIQHDEEPLWHMLNLHESVGGQLTTVPPICPTPGLMVRTIERWLEEGRNKVYWLF